MVDKSQVAYLCVREVVPFICVQGQAETALVLAQMIAHEIGIFRQINSLKSQFP